MTLNDLAKFPMTWSIARPLCNSQVLVDTRPQDGRWDRQRTDDRQTSATITCLAVKRGSAI